MIEVQNIENIVPAEILAALDPRTLDEILIDVAEAARSEWIRIAQSELFSSRRDYINGIQQVRFQPGVATITLLGVLPNLIEDGMDTTDMHETLLGPNVKSSPVGSPGKHPRKDGGYFRSIPFRHSGPGSKGATGQPMGRPYAGSDAVKDAGKLGRAVYKAAKKLEASTSTPGVGTAYGGRLPAGMAPKLKPYHATDLFAGMIRLEKTYEKTTQSQYLTFRTISVDGGGNPIGGSPWIRPQTPGRGFAKQVGTFVQKIAPEAFAAYVDGLK